MLKIQVLSQYMVYFVKFVSPDRLQLQVGSISAQLAALDWGRCRVQLSCALLTFYLWAVGIRPLP